MRKPIIDISECVLCDICVELCPEVFIKNQAGYIEISETVDQSLDEIEDAQQKKGRIKHLEDEIEEVIRNCRGDCISWGEKAKTEDM